MAFERWLSCARLYAEKIYIPVRIPKWPPRWSFAGAGDFLAFFARISYFKFLELKEFNKTIIPFALVGYETGYSQLGATRLVGYLPSHIQRALME